MRTAFVLAAVTLASAATSQTQIPLPAFGNTYIAAGTRGFWFNAPIGFTIVGLRVPNEASQAFQCVEVIDLGASAPPAYPGTIVGTQLFYNNSTATGNIIPCAIPIAPGANIGILGICTQSVGNPNSYNSYTSVQGPFATTVLGSPVTLTRFGTQSGISSNGGNQPVWQEAAFQISRVEVYVSAGSGNFALAQPYGAGCNDGFASFYETFAASTFDLSNMSRQMLTTGTGYIVLPGSNNWFTPVSANLGLTDDSVSGALNLGFTLNYPGGSTTAVYVSSNGYVWAQANTNNGCCGGDPVGLLTLGPRWCALWNDLNPSAGGTVQFDQDVPNGAAYVTFTGVPEYPSSNSNTFQFAFFASGTVELRWQTCAVTSHQVVTGWSPGANNRNPGSIDISATPVITTGPDQYPLALGSSGRPQLGTTISLNSTNVPAGSGLVILAMGLTEYTAGLSLAGIGMPTCFQYTSLGTSLIAVPSGGSASQPINVPSNAGLAGLVVLTQSAALAPGANTLGLLSSNGVRLTLNPN